MSSVLITGSSKGLGRELALEFSRANYDILLHGRNTESLEEVQRQVSKNGVDCRYIQGDLRSEETIQRLAAAAIQGDISLLVCNAAINHAKNLENLSAQESDDLLAINLIAPIKLAKPVYEHFLRRGSGTIMMINALDGLRAKKKETVYCAAKYGLKGFTEALRLEAKDHNVRVIGVYLGGMQTDMYSGSKAEFLKCMDPKEVAQTIAAISKFTPTSGVDDITINRQNYGK